MHYRQEPAISWPMLEPRECGEKAVLEGKQKPVALVFGRENNGLTNEELQMCNYHVCIPANPEYSSLNLAMAVQIIAYEVRVAFLAQQEQSPADEQTLYPQIEQMEKFYQHLEQTLNETGFIIKQHPGIVMTRLRRLFARSRPDEQELNILRGILASIQRTTKS
jgi:tRNA (cytidine32/uridine32-2'-O)-methyltransferase